MTWPLPVSLYGIWLKRLGRQAKDLPAAQPHFTQLAAVRAQRLLLEASDPVAPLRVAIAQCLRDAVNQACDAHVQACDQALATLGENGVWKKLPPADQAAIQQSVGLVRPTKPSLSTDEELLAHVEAHPLAVVQTEIDAIAGRLQQAIERAAKRLEPQVQIVSLERITLRTEDDVNAWVEKTKLRLIAALGRGPILIK